MLVRMKDPIEGMPRSGRSFNLHQNLSERCIDIEHIFIWYKYQACCIAGYSDITPGPELSERPS